MRYLAKDEWEQHTAGFLMMGCFVGGFFGIQLVSRVLHQYMPSHVVDCDHTHKRPLDQEHAAHHGSLNGSMREVSSRSAAADPRGKLDLSESTPLLRSEVPRNGHVHTEILDGDSAPAGETVTHFRRAPARSSTHPKLPPSMTRARSRVMSFFRDTKANCDEEGPCYGYSDPCGQECLKHLGTRSPILRRASMRAALTSAEDCRGGREGCNTDTRPRLSTLQAHAHHAHAHTHAHAHAHAHAHTHARSPDSDSDSFCPPAHEDGESQHHHHVPANAFLSISLQTVIAIALHKFPEGFITYATNHANPSLGFDVFMALFVHNIAEGFAMALPLYMALGSRARAVGWSSLLGGLSQPLGAAVAVAWFRIADRSNFAVNNSAYACLFAVTAGIMVSVALQLFVESLSLSHNRDLSIFFAFLGMTLLGVSSAFVSH